MPDWAPHARSDTRPPSSSSLHEEPSTAPAPRRGREIVIAWQASLMYLLEDGRPVGKPLVLNSSKERYLREEHLGSFRITEKRRLKRSNLYDVNGDPLPSRKLAPSQGAVMRNWMRIGPLAIGLHYSPAFRFHRRASRRHRSHGCYRMSRRDSARVFRWAPVGTPVHVVRNLSGTEWEFLRAYTPPERLPGYRPERGRVMVAERSLGASRRSARHRVRARRTAHRLARRASPRTARLRRPVQGAPAPPAPEPSEEPVVPTPPPTGPPDSGNESGAGGRALESPPEESRPQ